MCLINLEMILIETLHDLGCQVAGALNVERRAVSVHLDSSEGLLRPVISIEDDDGRLQKDPKAQETIAAIYRGAKMALNDRRHGALQVRKDDASE